MSSVSKKREKRSSSSTDDYNSFVKNVTSRVTSFLPETITKWLSPSTSKSNGSAPAADVTDSSTEDEAPDPVILQPPAKRMKISVPRHKIWSNPPEFNHFNPSEMTCVNTSTDAVEPKFTASNTPEMTNSKMFFNSNVGLSTGPKRKSIFQITPKNESSRTPQAKVTKEADNKSKSSIPKPMLLCSPFYPGQTMYGGASSTHVNQANIKQRKVALVNESKSNDNTMSHSARRVMELLENASTPLMEAKRISQYINNSNSSVNNCSSGASRIKYAPYSPKPLSYKMQELHVPNVASIMQLKQRSRLMDTTNAARQIIASHSSTSPYQPRSTDTQRDLEGNQTKDKFVTKIKSKLNGPRHSTKEPEHAFITPLNLPTGVLQIGKDNMPTFTFTSMESKIPITKTNNTTTISPALKEHELNKQKEDISASKVKESVIIKARPNASVCGKQSMKESKLSESVLLKSGLSTFEPLSNNDTYKFSSPVRICNEITFSTTPPDKFTFGSPERSIDNKTVNDKNKEDGEDTSNKEFENLSRSISKNWQCSNCSVSNLANANKCISCGDHQILNDTESKSKCSVCMVVDSQSDKDKCLNCEKIKSPTINCDSSKWTCQDCWVKNDQNVEKCICCGAINSKKSTSTGKSLSVKTFETENACTETDWKCNNCWVRNKHNVDKCAACDELKPGTKQNICKDSFSKSPFGDFVCNKTDNSLKHIVKLQSDKWNCPTCLVSNDNDKARCVCCDFEKPGTIKESSNLKNVIEEQMGKWECPSCLVRNDKNRSKCVCCESEKPGAVKETSNLKNIIKVQTEQWECPSCLVRNENNRSKCICCEFEKPGTIKENATKTTFNFGMNTNTTFKFGIDAKVQGVEMMKKPDVVETNNNILPKAPSFTFGIPPKKDDDQTDATKETECKITPKINFNFGIPKTQTATEPAVVTPAFVSTNKLSDSISNKVIEVKEKPQEVPKIEFTLPKPKETIKPLPAIFGSQLHSQAKQDIPVTSTISLNPSVTTESKNTHSNPLMIPPAAPVTSTQVTQSHNIFAFASSGLKPAVNLFTAPATTTLSFTSSVQSSAVPTTIAFFHKPETTTSPFQKTDSIISPTVSLFQKPENTTTVAPLSMATTAPVFSFGTNGPQNLAPQPEKPKFNFTFGGINPLFTNTFNAASDVNTNKFDISGNSGTANSVLSAGGALPGNSLAANKLGSNELPTNHSTSGAVPQAPGSGIFVTPVQKDNLWLSATSNSSNSFVSTSSTSLPKPATFTFGSSMPFNASSPAFGGNQTPTQNMFAMNQSASSQPSMFSTPVPNQAAPCLFGNPQPASNPTPTIGLFGSPNVGATPSFGAPRPAFEVTSITPAPAPAFNFNASQPNGVFGLVQQQPQPQQGQQAGMYNFAVSPGGAPQFNIGSAPNTGVRRVRKAVRRNCQR